MECCFGKSTNDNMTASFRMESSVSPTVLTTASDGSDSVANGSSSPSLTIEDIISRHSHSLSHSQHSTNCDNDASLTADALCEPGLANQSQSQASKQRPPTVNLGDSYLYIPSDYDDDSDYYDDEDEIDDPYKLYRSLAWSDEDGGKGNDANAPRRKSRRIDMEPVPFTSSHSASSSLSSATNQSATSAHSLPANYDHHTSTPAGANAATPSVFQPFGVLRRTESSGSFGRRTSVDGRTQSSPPALGASFTAVLPAR